MPDTLPHLMDAPPFSCSSPQLAMKHSGAMNVTAAAQAEVKTANDQSQNTLFTPAAVSSWSWRLATKVDIAMMPQKPVSSQKLPACEDMRGGRQTAMRRAARQRSASHQLGHIAMRAALAGARCGANLRRRDGDEEPGDEPEADEEDAEASRHVHELRRGRSIRYRRDERGEGRRPAAHPLR